MIALILLQIVVVLCSSQKTDYLSPQNFTEEAWDSTVQKLNEAHTIRFGTVPLT